MGVITKIVSPKLEATVEGHIHRKANEWTWECGMPPPGQRGAACGYGVITVENQCLEREEYFERVLNLASSHNVIPIIG
nr:hypothetical protein CFP56_48229 [Quercus suber]